MNPLDYLHLQLRLEGKKVVDGNRLRQVEAVPDEEMPLMIVAQPVNNQAVAYYDESLERNLYLALKERMQTLVFAEIDPLLEILQAENIPFEVGHYRTYLFPSSVRDTKNSKATRLSRFDPLVQAFGFGDFSENVYAIERDGKVVSACVSTRENGFCGEAWVYTEEHYRKQGFAQQVVQAWAGDMLAANKVPFYSHKIENTASANLAKRLGLKPVFEEIVIERR